MNPNPFFAERFRVALAKSDRTQADLANRLGLSRVTLHHWSSGNTKPKDRYIEGICEELGCSREWLMTEAPVDVRTGEGIAA